MTTKQELLDQIEMLQEKLDAMPDDKWCELPKPVEGE